MAVYLSLLHITCEKMFYSDFKKSVEKYPLCRRLKEKHSQIYIFFKPCHQVHNGGFKTVLEKIRLFFSKQAFNLQYTQYNCTQHLSKVCIYITLFNYLYSPFCCVLMSRNNTPSFIILLYLGLHSDIIIVYGH